jgi:hypothetical protein
MSLLVLSLLVALVVGWVSGGSLDRLGRLPLRSRRLVLLAFATQLVGTLVGGPLYPVALAVSAALVVAFLARNRSVRGTGLIALGLLANALVVGANGAMPVSAHAAARAGVPLERLASDARHELADGRTRLPWLADVVPVAFPPRPEVVSPGDALVTAGAAQLVVVGMTRRAPRPPEQQKGRQRRALPPRAPAPGSTTPSSSSSSSRRRRPPAPARAPRPGASRS